MNRGSIISLSGHSVVLLWAAFGGFFLSSDQKEDAVPVSTVSVLSEDAFAALSAPQSAPDANQDIAAPEAPSADNAPEAVETEDARPATAETAQPQAQTPDANPEAVPEEPPIRADVADDAPIAPAEPETEQTAVLIEPVTTAPRPRPAPRVAPTPAAAPAPDAQVDEIVREETSPDNEAEAEAPIEEPTAPQEAATEIVTEAEEEPEDASAAPVATARPAKRPKRPAPAQAETQTETQPQSQAQTDTDSNAEEDEDALANAIAGAVSQANESSEETDTSGNNSSAPVGPPLTGSEREGLRVAVSQCWNVGSMSSEALRTTVVVGLTMQRDGRPDQNSFRLISSSGGSGAAAKQAYETARRAVIRCGGNGYDLPAEKYEQWREIEMTFDPEKMRAK